MSDFLEKDTLNYKPNLSYSKNYYTEGIFEDSTSSNDTNSDKSFDQNSSDKNIIDILRNELNSLLSGLPDSIKNSYLSPLYGMDNEYSRLEKWYDEIFDNTKKDNNNKGDSSNGGNSNGGNSNGGNNNNNNNNNSNNNNSNSNGGNGNTNNNNSNNNNSNNNGGNNNNNNNNNNDNGNNKNDSNIDFEDNRWDGKLDKKDDDKVKIENEKKNTPPDIFEIFDNEVLDFEDKTIDIVSTIKKQYYFDFTDLYENYLKELIASSESYLFQILQLACDKNLGAYLGNLKSTDLKNKDLIHLTDLIAKTDIKIEHNLMLHKKIFSMDQTIVHIRAIRILEQTLERYKPLKELENETILERTSNGILRESILNATKKYEDNFLNLYKYLNSSVILLTDTLNLMKKQIVSMATLSKHEFK